MANIRSAAKRLGSGILDGLVIIADASTLTEMRSIDAQIDELFEKRRELNARLQTENRYEYTPKNV